VRLNPPSTTKDFNFSYSQKMHSSNPDTSQQSLTSSLENNPTSDNLERLKQQSQHCNGNTHNNRLTSTSTQTNHNQLNLQAFTNSQKEILRLIGQHLQSVGLGKTVDSLISESGCVLEHEQTSNFRELIMSGKWTEVSIHC
jgi:hypothetical protein